MYIYVYTHTHLQKHGGFPQNIGVLNKNSMDKIQTAL